MLSLLHKIPSKKVLMHMFFSFLIEFAPILIFVFSYRFLHIYKATFLLMLAVIISTFITYIKEKRIPYIGLYLALLTTIFGYITITYHIPKFIQMRDTIYDLTFALTLILGLAFDRVILQLTLNSSVPMTKSAWVNITYSWITFLILNACANEYIRRHFNFSFWVEYKMSVIFISIIFGLITGVIFYKRDHEKNTLE